MSQPTVDQASGPHVLVVEDNPVNRRMLVKVLALLGIASDAVASGREALETFDPARHRLVITDLRMPEMTGFDLARELRRREAESARERVPIIAFTADARVETPEKCRQAGMDGYLAKPLEMAVLRRLLEQWL